MFVNKHAPTAAELRQWAYTSDAEEPCQDFDLILSWNWNTGAYLDFVADPACPGSDYFLALLYLMVGDAVRTRFRNVAEVDVRAFIARADGTASQRLRTWQMRSLQLLKEPGEFDYDEWCAGALARRA